MAFEQLHALGEEKFTKILNSLARKEPCKAVARGIQQAPPVGWGNLQSVSERSLMMMLNRLRRAAAEGTYSAAMAHKVLEAGKPAMNPLSHISVPALTRMEELSEAQRALVMVLLAKATEEKRTYKSVNDATNVYRQTLIDLQKMRFEMGLDEYHMISGVAARGASVTTTYPDGTSVQKQVCEAVEVLQQVFDSRNIPRSFPRE